MLPHDANQEFTLKVSKITDKRSDVLFTKTNTVVLDKKGSAAITTDRIGGLCYVYDSTKTTNVVFEKSSAEKLNLLHK